MAKRKEVALSNKGALELTFVGSGSAFTKKFFQTNLLVVKGEEHLLVDCGSRGPEALSQLGLSVTTVRNYLITHSHADHIGGLEEVMLVNRYVAKKKPRIIITKEYQKELWGMSLKGGAAYNEEHEGKYLEFDDMWDVQHPTPVKNGWRQCSHTSLGSIDIRLYRTKHIPDTAPSWKESFTSYCVLFDESVLFTSDTRFDPELLAHLDSEFGLKAIFHDCQLYRGGVHASLEELATLPESLKNRIYLVHYQDSVEQAIEKAKTFGFKGFVEQWKRYRF